MDDLLLPPGAERIVGTSVARVDDLSLPWSDATRTMLVTPGGGEPLVVQWSRDRAGIARRIRLAGALARVAPGLPVPPVLGGDPLAEIPWLVQRHVAGTLGRTLLDAEEDAALLGTAVGGLARKLRAVPVRGLRLPRRWADPDRLQLAARGWLAHGRDVLGADTTLRLGRRIDAIPGALDATPVFAHGDLAPVNVLLREGVVVALLDLERARLAHPLYDAAWWTWIIRIHHPERSGSAGVRFFEAADLGRDPNTLERLSLLAVLQCLEMLATQRRTAVADRREWARRLAVVLEGVGPA